MSGRVSLPLPAEGKGLGRFASAEHVAWLKAESLRLAALFGIEHSDAVTIARQFRAYPDQRRSEDLTNHCALTLRARKRFLSGRGKAVAA